jgi:thioester reductase-like protein
MTLFLTGSTGYLGSYIATGILREHSDKLALLVRARDKEAGTKRLWKSLQLHMDFEEFQSYLKRIEIYLGDLTQPDLGLDKRTRGKLVRSMDSVIHCAASLNRKSAKSCFNVNLRGTLEVIKMARDAHDHHGMRRFSDISTVATAGHRKDEVVTEDKAIQWDRSDYDPYARTKKFCEHMIHELLPEVPATVFRPSIILGDSHMAQTTQFDMVRAFVMLAQMPVLPFRPEWRIDIVPANYVGAAVVKIHQKDKPLYDAYNLSAGRGSLTYQQVVHAMERDGFAKKPHFVPLLEGAFTALVDGLAMTPRKWGIALPASLMKVFLPYLVFNTVFDNSRVVEEMGYEPASFDQYAYQLFDFATRGNFQYPYKDWPQKTGKSAGQVA